jgi:outer membrane protein OmpA-like peptidoglycan-associated protein
MFFLNKMSCSLFLVSLLWQINANAQEVKMYTGSAPSAEEMGKILFSSQPSTMKPEGIKMRSINFGKSTNSQQELPKQAAQASQQDSAVGLPIKFGYNSAEILEDSKTFLNEIGRMLSMPDFASEKLVIEGHTDASGSDKYNMYLSERRAESVKEFLRNNFNIASNRLFVTGMGESQPLQGVAPHAPVNRRVQFRKAP